MSSMLTLRRLDEVAEVAAALLYTCRERRVFAFRGTLGAGKTTLIKALCAELGVDHGTSSPSFAIVNEYRDTHEDPIYHLDLYRLQDPSELDGIGFDDYLFSGHYCFVEWPELASHRLPPETVFVDLHQLGSARTVHIDMAPLPRQKAMS